MSHWVDAAPVHRLLLPTFQCAPKSVKRGRGTAARSVKEPSWAWDVQGIVRNAPLPPKAKGEFTRLRLSDDGAAPLLEAALLGYEGRARDEFDFGIIALARDVRTPGTGIGDDMLAEFDACCRARAGDRKQLELAAAVHVQNLPAQAMFARNGWDEGAALGGDPRYRRWGKLLHV